MEYINDLIRRKDRLLSEDEAMSLLENGEYGVLSISSTEEGVYGIPINYVWDKQSIFIVLPKGISFVYFKTVIRHRFAW